MALPMIYHSSEDNSQQFTRELFIEVGKKGKGRKI
jgi:hypothetical protein